MRWFLDLSIVIFFLSGVYMLYLARKRSMMLMS